MKTAVYFDAQDIRCINNPDSAIQADHEMLVKVTANTHAE